MKIINSCLRRAKDEPLFIFSLKSYILLFTGLICYLIPDYRVYALLIHFVVYVLLLGRFITMFHDINHYPLLKNKLFNKIYIDVLGVLYGFTPRTYFVHHVLMHHPGNNEFEDISSTLTYRRDSFADFARYYVKFFFSVKDLRTYFKNLASKNLKKQGNRALIGELAYIVMITCLAFYDFFPTLVIFIIPLFLTRSLLITGNWGEHAFIDPDDYMNLYRSSTNVVGKYNERNFNVGYHIGHHLYPSLHYSELPAEFESNIEKYGKEDVMVFKDIHYPHIWLYLMTKNYRKLLSLFVSLPGAPIRTDEELIACMKNRVRPILKGEV